MGQGWIQRAVADKRLEMVGLVDVSARAAEASADRHGLADVHVGTDLKAALKACEPDVVFDVTTPEAHCDVVTRSLAAGCHVLGEKPMADTMPHARRMVAAARKAKRVYCVTQNYRYNPMIRGLARFLRRGGVGDLTTVCADFFLAPHFGGFRDAMDYPLLLDMAIHTFDAARLISGADPVAVYTHSFNPRGSWYQGDASAVCVFEMTGGLVFAYRGSWCAEGHPTPWNSQWRIVGTRGTAVWDGQGDPQAWTMSPRAKGFRKPARQRRIVLPTMARTAHAAITDEFIRAVRTGRQPETVCDDNIKSLAMVHAAIKSAKTGRRVAVLSQP